MKVVREKVVCECCDGVLIEGDVRLCYSTKTNEPALLHSGCEKQFKASEKGLTHKCPKCYGYGKVTKTNNPFQFQLGWVNYHEDYNYDPCGLCDGNGYLAKEPIPVQKVVEWKKAK